MRDWQVHALGTVAADRFLGGGIGLALRPPGRLRWALAATGGALDRSFAVRLEALASFHPNPDRPRGLAPYTAAGVALDLTRQDTQGYLEFLLGVESGPGARGGWFAEVGIGGGVRVAAGFRLRQRARKPGG